MRIAVVRNRENKGIVNRFGQECPETYGKRSVQRIIDALRWGGHRVKTFEGDGTLVSKLRDYMPPGKKTGRPTGLVFNLAYGIQGDCRYTHVPGMLEMAGVPYTGASPYGHVLSLDKVITKMLMKENGIPTPAFRILCGSEDDPGELRFPLIVKPRHESTSYGLRKVNAREELAEAVGLVTSQYQQGALVEEYIEGREIHVALLGNDPVETFPLVEFDFGDRSNRMMNWEDKYHQTDDEPVKVCPAAVDPDLGDRIRRMAVALFQASGCRDYARVDIRVDRDGNPFVLEINSMASLGKGGAYVLSARVAGYSFESLICRIVDVAHRRYYGTEAQRKASSADAILIEEVPEDLLERVEQPEEEPAVPAAVLEPVTAWGDDIVEVIPTQEIGAEEMPPDPHLCLPELRIDGEAA